MKSITFRVADDGKVRIVEGLKAGGGVKKHTEADTHDYELLDRVGVRELIATELADFLSDVDLPEKVPGLFDQDDAGTAEPVKISMTKKPKSKSKK